LCRPKGRDANGIADFVFKIRDAPLCALCVSVRDSLFPSPGVPGRPEADSGTGERGNAGG